MALSLGGLRRSGPHRRGASANVYVLSAALLALVSVSAVGTVGRQIDALFCEASASFDRPALLSRQAALQAQSLAEVVAAEDTRVVATGRSGPATAGQPLFLGDRLQTGPAGQVAVLFVDGTRIGVGAQGTMNIDDMVWTDEDGTVYGRLGTGCGAEGGVVARLQVTILEAVFGVDTGDISTGPNTEPVEVRTELFTIGVRGTEFYGRGTTDPNETSYAQLLTDGSTIEVRGANGASRVLTAEREYWPIDPLVAPAPLSAADTTALTGGLRALTSGTLDLNGPVLQAFERSVPYQEDTTTDTLIFRAVFDEAVIAIDPADFTVTGGTTATVTAVEDAVLAREWSIIVSGGDLAAFAGTVGINLAGAQDITDTNGNPLPAGEPSVDETYNKLGIGSLAIDPVNMWIDGGNNIVFIETTSVRVSSDGRFVAFHSNGQWNSFLQQYDFDPGIYVLDRADGSRRRVEGSVDCGRNGNFALSGNGRYLVYGGNCIWQSPDGTITGRGMVRHDLTDDSRIRVDVNFDGSEDFSTTAALPSISDDGDVIAFVSSGQSITDNGDTPVGQQFYVRNMRSATNTMISIDHNGNMLYRGFVPLSFGPVISGNGRFVAFKVMGGGVPPDLSNGNHIMIRDIEQRTTTVLPRQALSGNFSITRDGAFLNYTAANGQEADDNYNYGVAIYESASHTVSRVRINGAIVDPLGTQEVSFMSSDGTKLLVSTAQHIGSDDPTANDAFLIDLPTGTAQHLSRYTDGVPGLRDAEILGLSGDGRIALIQTADDLTRTVRRFDGLAIYAVEVPPGP